MPTYEYACDACGHEFEEFQSITADPLRKCPKCGKAKLQRLISSGGGLIFKGSGFYITDYRSESYKQAQQAESKAASGGDKSESKSTETKSDSSSAGGDKKPAEKKTTSDKKPAGKKKVSS